MGPRGPRGGTWGGLGGPFGGCRGPWGTPGLALETHFGKQAALQNQWFYNVNGYIWPLGGFLGDLGWDKFLTKAGEGEGNGDRGAHDKPKAKQEGAG